MFSFFAQTPALNAVLQGQANCPNCRTPWEFKAAEAGEGSEADGSPMEDDELPEREDTPGPL